MQDRQEIPLSITLFGPFTVRIHGQPLKPLYSRKGQWLLALLTLHSGQEVPRSKLAGLLWPDSPESQSLFYLRKSLSDLRQALGDEAARIRSASSQALVLDLSGAEGDVLAFDQAIACGDSASLEQAVTLYRGPLLEGCAEDWVLTDRRVREEAYLNALETLATHSLAHGDPAAAVGYLHKAIHAERLREKTYRTLMQALAARGDYAAAIQVYRDLNRLLHHELNALPAPETTALYQQLRTDSRRQVALSDRRKAAQPLPPVAPTPQVHLPGFLTAFLGRETEIHDIQTRLLASRLVTLAGPGGVGKTRLAVRVAEEMAELYPDGVWFVDLAPVTDPERALQSTAFTLGVREETGRPLQETLIDWLREKQLLLLLDNCEHLTAACAALAHSLVTHCPRLRLLATSRQSLGLTGEVTYRVPPLALPPAAIFKSGGAEGDKGLLSALLEYEAIRLFVDRASEASPAFVLTMQNAPAVAQICAAVDGNPLALELAAARVKALSVEQVAARLEDRFRLLTRGSRSASQRHQTLRATIDWSYYLLNAQERRLLARLSVFAGGWTLEAAEQVTGDREQGIGDRQEGVEEDSGSNKAQESIFPETSNLSPITSDEVLDLLEDLVDKSLVVVETENGTARYRLLEMVRLYAHDRFIESSQDSPIRDRHASYFLGLAEKAQGELHGPEQADWLARLETEHDNLRAALSWSADKAGGETGLKLATALYTFWYVRGYLHEGREWLARLLEKAQGVTPVRAKALNNVGNLASVQGDYEAARLHYDESLRLQRELGDELGVATVLGNLGRIACLQSDYATAMPLFEESLAIRRRLEDRRGIAVSLNNLANVFHALGDNRTVKQMTEESLALHREFGDRLNISNALRNLGSVALEEGDPDAARALYEESLAIRRELEDRRGAAYTLRSLAEVMSLQGDAAAARAMLEESLATMRQLGERQGTAEALCMLARLDGHLGDYTAALTRYRTALPMFLELADRAAFLEVFLDMAALSEARGNFGRAAQLCGAIDALLHLLKVSSRPDRQKKQEELVTNIRAQMGQATWNTAWESGRSRTLEQAVTYALLEI